MFKEVIDKLFVIAAFDTNRIEKGHRIRFDGCVRHFLNDAFKQENEKQQNVSTPETENLLRGFFAPFCFSL